MMMVDLAFLDLGEQRISDGIRPVRVLQVCKCAGVAGGFTREYRGKGGSEKGDGVFSPSNSARVEGV